ncbi:Protocadherin-like wing polarity protein stan [Anabarilius grahami]|uniref:Protocadherin-like wing polarity protein stan n=1 Tax=Anabarilius grahami TaxID=495550 RepID=A0A3N0YLC0_ANAGA|nr:Protocadherin-like wing polarity protein stan [Anabarilius grahami]
MPFLCSVRCIVSREIVTPVWLSTSLDNCSELAYRFSSTLLIRRRSCRGVDFCGRPGCLLRVSITDVNDNAPVFSSDIYSKSILVKDAKVGDVLLTLSATDKDAGSNALISYRFSEVSSMVALDAETGDITLTSDLSEVTEDTLLTLTAIATDHGTPPESDEAEVLIYFKIAPFTETVAFESSSYKFTIKENEPEASIVGKVRAITGDPVVAVSYNMKSHKDIFSVDGEGTIKALRPLDKEEEEWYILTVEAIDSRTPPNTAETMVSVQVENMNEAPVFDTEIYKAEIFNISPYKFPIVKVQAWDPDVGESSELQYSLQESTTLLDVEANTGQVYVLDASSFGDNLFTFHVKATDKHGLFTTTTVQIEVKQSVHHDSVSVISLNQPVYIVEKMIPEMEDSMEKALGWTVKILSVRAEDGIEMRSILRDSSDKSYVSFIAMDSSGAVIKATEVKQKLNTEHKALTSELEKVFGPGLEIKVEDSPGNSEDPSQAITNTLIAVSVVLVIISVTLASTIIHLVKYDDRLVLEGFFDSIGVTFLELVYTNGDSTATVRTVKPLDAEKLKETGGVLSYSVTCSNTGVKHQRWVNIRDVNDNLPIFQSKSYSVTVSEATAVGSDVLRPPAPDEFEVRDDGNIRLTQPLNYNNAQQYIFTVQAKDIGEFSDTTTVTITVEDFDNLNPYFDHSLYKASIVENQVGQFSVVTPEAIKAQDGDTGINEPVVYSITAVFPNEYQSNFEINENSGVISVTTALDREEIDQINVHIQATQQDDASKTANAVVSVTIEDVDDSPPKFDQDEYTVSILENSLQDQLVLQTRVTDLDLGGFSKGHFIMDSDTFIINSQGVISLRSDATLDRETLDNYNIEVIAVDQPVDGLSSTAQVIITVLDVNDNNPQFLPLPEPIEIQEGEYTSSSPGEVCEILVTDADIGDNGRFTITTSSHSEIFRFRENITTVRVSITDVNDNAPVFSSDTYSKSILVKDAKVGDVLLTLSATDKDAGSNALISYRFSEDSSMVALDAETGDITLTSDLSGVTEDTLLTLTAIATDHGTPPESDEAEVLIYFRIAPFTETVAFESSSYKFTIKENEPEASIVGKVRAFTGDPVVMVSYNMKSHKDVFSVDGEGTIKALRPLDKEEEEWYILTVEAIDSRTPPNTAETTVNVQVENVNEAPVFDAEIYKAEMFNISPYKFPILKVQAWDPDVGESSELQYSLQESTTLLDVEANTGQIYVLDASRFGDSLFTFHAKVTDKHGLFTTTTVQIEVKQTVHHDSVSVISLNQPIYIVEKKITEMEESMEKVLGWTVKILSVRAEDGNEMRSILRESTDKTYISFIAMDSSGAVIKATEVKQKLNTDHKDLTSELEKVFGPGLEIKVEDSPGNIEDPSQAATIALGVLLAISIVTLTLTIMYFK